MTTWAISAKRQQYAEFRHATALVRAMTPISSSCSRLAHRVATYSARCLASVAVANLRRECAIASSGRADRKKKLHPHCDSSSPAKSAVNIPSPSKNSTAPTSPLLEARVGQEHWPPRGGLIWMPANCGEDKSLVDACDSPLQPRLSSCHTRRGWLRAHQGRGG